jgi:ATP-dependent DNA helicase RecG
MNPEAIAWLNQFADRPVNDHQRLALVYLRHHKQMTNSDYQRLNHVDSVIANRELRGIVQLDLIEQHSTRRWAYYTLNVPTEVKVPAPLQTDEEKILAYVREHGFIKRIDCQWLLDVTDIQARYILRKMRDRKLLRLEGSRKSAKCLLP